MKKIILIFNDIFYSIELSLLTPLYPITFLCFYDLFYIRLFRLLAGTSVILYLTEYYLYFYVYIQIIIITITTFQAIFMIVLAIVPLYFLFFKGEFLYLKHKSRKSYKSIFYFVLIIRIVLFFVLELMGMFGFNYLFWEICRGILDIKESLTKNKFNKK